MNQSINKKGTLFQQLGNGVLVAAVIVLLGFVSVRFKTELDWTANKRNTLTDASVQLLDSLADPVTFYVFAPSGADTRRAVEEDLGKYLREKKDIRVQYIDPSVSPQKVREFNINFIGEVVVEYQGRRENLRATTEQSITTALQRLSYSGEQFVVFLEGHGERAMAGEGPDSYARFAQALRDKGLKVQGLNLVQTPAIPDNTSVLVIASPTAKLFDGEIALIREYVNNGGNLLWLADPDFPVGIEPLAQDLGIEWQNGYAILPEYQLLGTGHPGFFAAIGYPPNAVTQGLDLVTLFPFVRSIAGQGAEGWTLQPMLQTSDAAWLETGDIEAGTVALDDTDIPGPLNIGVTLTRSYTPPAAAEADDSEGTDDANDGENKPAARPQRVVLVGDADFLADAYVGELGNQQLGLNIVQWLATRDAQLNIDIKAAPDTMLYLPGWATVTISAIFVLLLPLTLVGFGVARWAVRRRR
ncbi:MULTISPECIES: GldG family protein [Pseudomonadota]|uniref:GldG family protein n=1 Tax=Pseudomonadota TaxID=1224 RepID=UPI003519118A